MTSQRRWYHDDSLHLWIICYAIWVVLNWSISVRLEYERDPSILAEPLIEQTEPTPQPMPDTSVFLAVQLELLLNGGG